MNENDRKRPKLSDVARIAGVGKATASRVLNGSKNVSADTAYRVSEVIRLLGYEPNRAARSLKGLSSGIIGMIVPSISDMFFSRCAEAVETVVRQHDRMLIVTASHDRPTSVLDSFRQLMLHDIDGLILVQTAITEDLLLAELAQAQIPVVGIDRPLSRTRFSSVVCQNFEGARDATAHLIDHGYERIISLQVNPKLYTMQERRRGYSHAMRIADRTPQHEAVKDLQETISVLQREVKHKRPFAVFTGNNLSARYVLEAAVSLGLRIPFDVAILSFDDFELADVLNPPMSVVQQPVDSIGKQAATLLFTQMKSNEVHSKQDVVLPTQLVLRGSCGCSAD